MDENRGKGIGKQISGSIEEVAGKVADNTRIKAEGTAEKAVGKAQNGAGGSEDRVRENGTINPATNAAGVTSSMGVTSPMGLPPLQTEEARVAEEQIIPLYTENIAVSRRKVVRAVVRVATVTHEHPTLVDEQLTHERVEVEHVPINRMIDAVPPVRDEGDVTIIPVVEEIVVVERRLLLKEEVRLRKVRVTEQYLETIVLRDQDVVVTRTAPSDGPAQSMPSPGAP